MVNLPSPPDDAAHVLRVFGTTLRSERRTAGLTQEQLSHAAGIDRSYVGQVERGERNVALINIVRFARALHVPPHALLADLATDGGGK